MNKTADELLFCEEEVKLKFRSMIVPEKILENDNIQEDKV
jgi:hypothetical protein